MAQYKNTKIQDPRQLWQTRCFCFSHCLLEVIHLHNRTFWITKAWRILKRSFISPFRPSSALIRQDNGSFRRCSSTETGGIWLKRRPYVWIENILKAKFSDEVAIITRVLLKTHIQNDWIIAAFVDGNYLMYFPSEISVFQLFRRSPDAAA